MRDDEIVKVHVQENTITLDTTPKEWELILNGKKTIDIRLRSFEKYVKKIVYIHNDCCEVLGVADVKSIDFIYPYSYVHEYDKYNKLKEIFKGACIDVNTDNLQEELSKYINGYYWFNAVYIDKAYDRD